MARSTGDDATAALEQSDEAVLVVGLRAREDLDLVGDLENLLIRHFVELGT